MKYAFKSFILYKCASFINGLRIKYKILGPIKHASAGVHDFNNFY